MRLTPDTPFLSYRPLHPSRARFHALVLVLLALVTMVLSLAMAQRAQASMASVFSAEAGALSPLVGPTEPPAVEAKPATNLTQTSATLNATVNPMGGEVTKCEFEYGPTSAHGSTAPCTLMPGSGSAPVAVSAAISGLTTNTTYRFRISATNSLGTSASPDETFRTLPLRPGVVTGDASSIAQTTATLNGTVNPNGGEVGECKIEYGTTASYGSSAPCTSLPGSGSSPVAVSASVTGLAPNTTYHFRISATNASGTTKGLDETFKTLAEVVTHPVPTLETKAAGSITQTGATVNAAVNPNGSEVSECKFEYGTSTAYESTVACASLPGSGSSAVAVSAPLAGLTANTTYHFRISATNASGTTKGLDETFKTLAEVVTHPVPTLETKAAGSITQTGATVNAAVNPNGSEVSECKFEYGTSTAYESTVACASLPGSGSSAVAVSAPLAGLTANTTYHFRIVATNLGGTSKGNDETFTTPPLPAPTPSAPTGGGTPAGTVSGVAAGLPAPVLAKTANLTRVTGQVRVRLPGTRPFLTLSTPRQVPYGSIVEAIHGEVSVTAATPSGGTQRGQFFDGEFVLTQGRNGRVLATLTAGNFTVCQSAKPARARSTSASRAHIVRRLWAEGRGNFSTKGRYAGGIVQGAQWLTEDMCQGTLILATREHVEVTDLVRHRHIQVLTGGIYLAKRH